MKTKVGDWVRICFNAWTRPSIPVMACLSSMRYRVEHIENNGNLRVRSKNGIPMNLRSWVRASP